MAFWNDPSTVTPKQSHRWVVYFSSLDNNKLQPYYVKSIKKPSYEIQTETARLMYSYDVNFPKRLVWKPISIEFYDVNNSNFDTERHFLEIFKESGYLYGNYKNFTYKRETTKNFATFGQDGNKFMKIVELGEYGNIREEWKIYNPLITSVSPSNLNYESDEVPTISVEVDYDYAVLDIAEAGKHSVESGDNTIKYIQKETRTDVKAKEAYYLNLRDFSRE